MYGLLLCVVLCCTLWCHFSICALMLLPREFALPLALSDALSVSTEDSFRAPLFSVIRTYLHPSVVSGRA